MQMNVVQIVYRIKILNLIVLCINYVMYLYYYLEKNISENEMLLMAQHIKIAIACIET